jgi:hypothetical protein
MLCTARRRTVRPQMQTRPSTIKSLAIKEVFKEVDVLKMFFFDHDILARLDAAPYGQDRQRGKTKPLSALTCR